MSFTPSHSQRASRAYDLVQDLQAHLLRRLGAGFVRHDWLRDSGKHGGGYRQTHGGGAPFNRASLNVSHVHYDDEPQRPLGSATALSSIVHPLPPRAPSLHIHISWTEMKAGAGSWRLMADLNPSIPDRADTALFREALQRASGPLFGEGAHQGDRYFHIPALDRHRGVAHFYLEQYRTPDEAADRAFAARFGATMIDAYGDILQAKLAAAGTPSPADEAAQRAYHTVYLFQVLTLDRGTTSGLLVHDQNDLGILGSLPAFVDRALLASWEARVPQPQDELVRAIADIVPATGEIGDKEKLAFCGALRTHYAKYPAALELQARGDVVPPTVQSHGR